MTKWEYHIEHFPDMSVTMLSQDYIALVMPRMNELGQQGWETIRVQPNLMWFRRAVPDGR